MKLTQRLLAATGTALLSGLFIAPAQAQEPADPADPAKSEDAEAEATEAFTPEKLEQLVAPIALYPDSLVSQVLMASTYPLDVIEADRWVRAQKLPLEGDALAKALEEQKWDPSVKSLIEFPDVLSRMSEKLDWTQDLGDAVLASEKDVLDAVQRLRSRAKESGNLETTKEQKVTQENQVIIIEPADPEVIYVPSYNPTVVYGTWPYPAYPPTYYYPPSYVYPPAYSFAAGVAVGLAWGYAWGGCGWGHGHIDVNVNRNINLNKNINRNVYKANGRGSGNWKHNPENRRGVRYKDNKTASKYGKGNRSRTSPSRDAYRGRTGPSAGRGATTNRAADRSRSNSGRAASTNRSASTRSNRASSSGSSSRRSGSSTRSSSRTSAFKNYESRSRTRSSSTRGHSSRSRSSGSRGASRGARGGGRRGR